MGFVLGIALKALGFGKILLGWIWDAVCGIFKFAVEKPFQFLTIVLALSLVFAGWYASTTTKELSATQKIVEEKVQFIKGQDKILKEYVQALKVEKSNHVSDINRSNTAVAGLKKTADAALAKAQAAGRAAEAKKQQYVDLATKYSQANQAVGTSDDRIKREEQTTDEFLKDWRKAK